jgi:hypothetical protein
MVSAHTLERLHVLTRERFPGLPEQTVAAICREGLESTRGGVAVERVRVRPLEPTAAPAARAVEPDPGPASAR